VLVCFNVFVFSLYTSAVFSDVFVFMVYALRLYQQPRLSKGLFFQKLGLSLVSIATDYPDRAIREYKSSKVWLNFIGIAGMILIALSRLLTTIGSTDFRYAFKSMPSFLPHFSVRFGQCRAVELPILKVCFVFPSLFVRKRFDFTLALPNEYRTKPLQKSMQWTISVTTGHY